MKGIMRALKQLTTGGLLVALLTISAGAATAVAESGPGKEGTPESPNSGSNSGPGSGDETRDTHAEDGRPDDPANPEEQGSSEDRRRDGRGRLPNPGKPKQGKTLNALPKGKVKVRLPGSRRMVTLSRGASIPVGSVVDTRHGQVTLNTVPREDGAKQWAAFSGAIFQVLQPKTGLPVTDIRLRGGNFASCGRPFVGRSLLGNVFASRKRKRRARSLWARGKGRFRTRGRHGAATVRGTVWLTRDTCAGTLVKVRRGVVDVRDFAKRKTVTVRAGQRYLARRPGRSRR